jgi:hypothetical protein
MMRLNGERAFPFRATGIRSIDKESRLAKLFYRRLAKCLLVRVGYRGI